MGKTVTRAAEAVATGGLSEFTHGADAFGVKTGLKALGWGGKSYTPTTLPTDDPVKMMSESGGAMALTHIALGTDVDTAVAQVFGRQKGQDFDAWLKGLSPDEQAAVNGLKDQLTQVQSNTQLRTQAVQQLTKDFPNVVSMTAPSVIAAKKAAGEEFDDASKQYLDYALHKSASSFAPNGMLSSGAALEEAGNIAADTGMKRLAYTDQKGQDQLGLLANDWNNQYTEANALLGFQQKMLGQGATQGASAYEQALNRNNNTNIYNADAINKANSANTAADNALDQSIGGLAGNALMFGAMSGGKAAAGAGAGAGGVSGTDAISSGAGSVPTGANANPASYGIGGGYR